MNVFRKYGIVNYNFLQAPSLSLFAAHFLTHIFGTFSLFNNNSSSRSQTFRTRHDGPRHDLRYSPWPSTRQCIMQVYSPSRAIWLEPLYSALVVPRVQFLLQCTHAPRELLTRVSKLEQDFAPQWTLTLNEAGEVRVSEQFSSEIRSMTVRCLLVGNRGLLGHCFSLPKGRLGLPNVGSGRVRQLLTRRAVSCELRLRGYSLNNYCNVMSGVRYEIKHCTLCPMRCFPVLILSVKESLLSAARSAVAY
jgi:hypothetical protein